MARVYKESPAPEPSFTRIRGGHRGRGSRFPASASLGSGSGGVGVRQVKTGRQQNRSSARTCNVTTKYRLQLE